MISVFIALTIAQRPAPDTLGHSRYNFLVKCTRAYPVKGKAWSSWPGDTMTGEIFFPLGRSDTMFVKGCRWPMPCQLAMYSKKGNAVTREWVVPLKFDLKLSKTPTGYLAFVKNGSLPAILSEGGFLLPKQLSLGQKKSVEYSGQYSKYELGFEGIYIALVGPNRVVDYSYISYYEAEKRGCLPTLLGESQAIKGSQNPGSGRQLIRFGRGNWCATTTCRRTSKTGYPRRTLDWDGSNHLQGRR